MPVIRKIEADEPRPTLQELAAEITSRGYTVGEGDLYQLGTLLVARSAELKVLKGGYLESYLKVYYDGDTGYLSIYGEGLNATATD